MSDQILKDVSDIANKYKIEKVILFGSRARGDQSVVSDFDIAVFANDLTPKDKAQFCQDIDEIRTLKKIDVVFVNENRQDELLNNINKEGVIIYGETGN